jgi:hypothetical protein
MYVQSPGSQQSYGFLDCPLILLFSAVVSKVTCVQALRTEACDKIPLIQDLE